MFNNGLIGLLHVLSNKVPNFLGEASLGVDRVGRGTGLVDDTVVDGDLVIVLTESRGLVDNTHTILSGNVAIVHYAEAIILELLVVIVKERLILPSEHVGTLKAIDNLELGLLRVLIDGAEQRLQKDVVLLRGLIIDLHVLEVGVSTKTGVGGKGPGCGSPCKQAGLRVIQ
jgi:hypothetical protein